MHRPAVLIGGALFFGIVAFGTIAALGALFALVCAVAAGAGSVLFVRFLDDAGAAPSHPMIPLAVAASIITVGVSLAMLSAVPGDLWPLLVAIPVAIGTAWGVGAAAPSRQRAECFICKTPLDAGSAFRCPRCKMQMCAQPDCWLARHFRCRYCDERDVPLFRHFPDAWWNARLGPRVTKGTCASCMEEAHETDLRECGQCHWSMCKRCWDHHNGVCTHCQWTIPDMPFEIYAFVRPHDVDAATTDRASRANSRR